MFSPIEVITLQSNPDVTVTLKRVGVGLRLRVETELAEDRFRQFELETDFRLILPNGTERKDLGPDDKKRLFRLDTEYDRLAKKIEIFWQKNVIQKITSAEGGEISIEAFIESAPEPQLAEIQQAIDAMVRIGAEQAKKSELPITSPEPADGQTPTTTADTVNPDTSTPPAAV